MTSKRDDSWRRTLAVLVLCHVVTAAGFSLVLPFLPLHLKQLEVLTGGGVTFWSGVVFTAPAVGMMLAAPLWGWLADRRGRKIMLLRATLAGGLVIFLMGTVNSVEALTALRLLQGVLTGYVAAVNALVAATAPQHSVGSSFGTLRTAAWIGACLGPLLGGVLGDTVGFRETFFVAGASLFGTGVLIWLMVQESFQSGTSPAHRSFTGSYRALLRIPGLCCLFSLSFLESLARALVLPIIPLYLLTLPEMSSPVATTTGLLFGIRAGLAALAAGLMGHLGDRYGHARVMRFCAGGLVLLYLPQALVTAGWQLVLLQALTGVAAVGILPNLSAMLTKCTPGDSTGAAFGMDSSVQSLGRAVGPMLGVALASIIGLRGAFASIALLYVLGVILTLPLSGRDACAAMTSRPEAV